MSKSNPLALVDMDGTLVNYDGAIEYGLEKIRDPNRENPPTTRHGDLPAFMENRIKLIRGQPGWWSNLEPLAVGKEIVNTLVKLEFDLHVLTQGPRSHPPAWAEKVEWCDKHYPNIDITVTRKKANFYGVVLVDDWPKFALSWLEHRPRGFVVMPAQPWNTEFANNANERVLRYEIGMQKELETRLLKRLSVWNT